MQRNKMIYALADAALVITSDFEKGGTWAGAIEQLAKLHFVPVFVREEANAGKGNTALLQHGAVRWPNPQNGDELSQALSKAAEAARRNHSRKRFHSPCGNNPPPIKACRNSLSQALRSLLTTTHPNLIRDPHRRCLTWFARFSDVNW